MSTSPRPVLRLLVVARDDAPLHLLADAAHAATRGKASVEAVRTLAEAEDAMARGPRAVLLDMDAFGNEALAFLSAVRASPAAMSAHVIVFGSSTPATERWRFDVYGIRDVVTWQMDLAQPSESLEATIRAAGTRVGWI